MKQKKLKEKFKVKKYFQTVTPNSAARGDYDSQGLEEEKTFSSVQDVIDYLEEEEGKENLEASDSGHFLSDHTYLCTGEPWKDSNIGNETTYTYHFEGLTLPQKAEIFEVITGQNYNQNQLKNEETLKKICA